MNYCLAILFLLAALLLQKVFGAALYYYNRNTEKIEYSCGNNNVGNYKAETLYIKRYFLVVVLSDCTEALERQIWLLLHSHQLGLTTTRSIHVRQRLIMCIFLDYLEAESIYQIVSFYFTIIFLMLIISRFKGTTTFDCQGSSCWYP